MGSPQVERDLPPHPVLFPLLLIRGIAFPARSVLTLFSQLDAQVSVSPSLGLRRCS